MVRFSEIQQFPDFVELLNGNFHTICTGYEISKVWSNEKRPNFQFNQDKGLAWKPAKADVASLQIL